ncbi:hypothetical protein FOA52_006283 [Chlamydomonas sp. UWO 241]|nr:hypothetical protein FOA52_006283 [Chlamydomonas sp. UWO 241]
MDALWPCLGTDGRRALRQCCTATRAAVDAHASGLDGGESDTTVLLSPATCSRLIGVHTLTLRSMACLRGMLVAPPHGQPGALFPHLQSLQLLLAEDGVAVAGAADYQAIATAAPWLTQLSLQLPGSATALPQHMASLLSVCSRLGNLTLYAPLKNLNQLSRRRARLS